jgi:preprotein translocase subunit YajC
LLAAISEFRVGDMIFQLIFFILLIALIVALVRFLIGNRRRKQLDRIEEKLDKLLTEKENEK